MGGAKHASVNQSDSGQIMPASINYKSGQTMSLSVEHASVSNSEKGDIFNWSHVLHVTENIPISKRNF